MPCTYSNSDSMCNDFAYIYYDVCASECIQGLLLLVYMALLFAAIVSTINKLSKKNNKELRDKIKNNYGKSL